MSSAALQTKLWDRLPFDGPTRAVIVALVLMIGIGGIFFPQFLSPVYLAQQMQNKGVAAKDYF